MRLLLVQPPFVQLNAPYPAVHYLAAWLRGRCHEVEVEDHSIELYRRLFSREGLSALFDEVERRRSEGLLSEEWADEIDRYLSYRPLYESWIDGIVDYLSGDDPAFAHRLAAALEFPRGARVEALLESKDMRPGPEDSQLLASLMLADLGDLLSQTVDPDFGTVRYGERLGRSRDDFGEVLAGLDASWLMNRLYEPWLRQRFAVGLDTPPRLILVSLPFPGSLAGALMCAREAKRAFGQGTTVVFGGGYVSTELRGLRDPSLFDACDFLVFDAGFGGLASILSAFEGQGDGIPEIAPATLHGTMLRREGRILCAGFPPGDLASTEKGCADEDCRYPFRIVVPGDPRASAEAEAVEGKALREAHPDYRDLDLPRYLRPIDSTNPMHRLWSESPWLKYRLAQGCYWKRCAFCDTELDYVRSYAPVELEPLATAMEEASSRLGLHGIHFVDEALPMSRLLAFSELNRRRGFEGKKTWHFWGNVRFDASWTPERIELLARSGLVAVSGGIEVATERGLAMTDKGFDLAGLVRTLVAFRRAGVLVHAYLIYGFPGQDEEDIVESAEFVRGLFATGLVDSAFWHRFVLTRHSRMYAEWREGLRPDLIPIDRGGSFAANDLDFEGEEAYDVYGTGLDAALGAWMEGEGLERRAREWLFPESRGARESSRKDRPSSRKVRDGVSLVESLVEEAERALDARPLPAAGRAYWTAGLPLIDGSNPATLRWVRQGFLENLDREDSARARRLALLIAELAAKPEGMGLGEFSKQGGLSRDELGELTRRGLVVLEGKG